MSKEKKPRPRSFYKKYTTRRCQSLLLCVICNRNITYGEWYYDGGYGRRAHAYKEDCDGSE